MILYLSGLMIQTDVVEIRAVELLAGCILLFLTSSTVVLALYVGHLRHQRSNSRRRGGAEAED